MPLGTIPNLTLLIRSTTDEKYAGFQGFPPTLAAAIQAWADVGDLLLEGVIPATTTAPQGREAMVSAMEGISPELANGLDLLYAGFAAYATIVAGGMGPAGFASIPPPLLLAHIPTGLTTNSATIEATNLATALVAWAKTGTATPLTGGAPINWT